MKTVPPSVRRIVSVLALFSATCCIAPKSLAETFLFDFGSNANPMDPGDDPLRSWNNVPASVGTVAGSQLFNLMTTDGAFTDVSLRIDLRFNGENLNGPTQPDSLTTPYPYFDAVRDSLFGNTGTGFNGIEASNPTFTLGGLDPLKLYSFTFFASRRSAGGDNRTTDYFVTGTNTASTSLNVAENLVNKATVSNIAPTASGEITVSLLAGAVNTNTNKFIYLGVLEVSSIPEPSAALSLLSGVGILALRRKRSTRCA